MEKNKNKNKNKNQEKIKRTGGLISEPLLIVLLIACFFVFISLITPNSMGVIGSLIETSLSWAFSYFSFVIIIAVITCVVMQVKFKEPSLRNNFLVFGILALTLTFISIFRELGFVGRSLATIFLTVFGNIGSFIVTFFGIILLTSILLGFSILTQIGIIFSKFKNYKSQEVEMPLYLHEEEKKEEKKLPVLTLKLEEEEIPIKETNEIKISGPVKIETSNYENNGTNENKNTNYTYPTRELLKEPEINEKTINRDYIIKNSKKLEETLKSFGVTAHVTEVSQGPTVTRYELSPGTGVKVSKISNLADDLALNLAAKGIRIEAPILGKSVVGVEIPNEDPSTVYFSELIASNVFKTFPSKLSFAIGKDIEGSVVVFDIAKMPHLLIAGATGSGKSVCINTLIVSLLYKSSPKEVKLIMIDPKVVELSVYDGIPHLLVPVVTDPKKAAGALNWAVREMLKRYEAFATTNVRDLSGYNKVLLSRNEEELPQIVIIIDELSDLMMAAPNEVEEAICRLAQMARAAGIHLIIATQRPSVDVITGLIKANVPSRLAFSVSSGTDSRTILDSVGAEKLLGRGDMLFAPIGLRKPLRVQGAFISDTEVENIVSFLKEHNNETYDEEMIQEVTTATKTTAFIGSSSPGLGEEDEFYDEAVKYVVMQEKASASMLQRKFRIGYQRASRLIENLEKNGVIGKEDGSKPRKVLISMQSIQNLES